MSVKKNPEVDNERMRMPLIFLGFFIVGSLTILSFSYEEKVEIASTSKNDQAAHDIPEQLEVIEEEVEEPVVQEIQELEIPEAITEEIVEIKSEDKDEAVVVEIMKIEEPPADLPPPPAEIVEYPEKEAGFPGGPAAMQKFLSENIKYPEIAMELGDAGRVFIEFVVNTDGTIEQVKVLRGVSKEIDAEARRVVRSMPRWEPAESNGEPVRARCRIPINFILQ